MGRLKKDHSSYKTHGLWLKYKHPVVNEVPKPATKKKDTKRWCRGKVGTEHNWHRYQGKRYNWFHDDWVDNWVETRCLECGKKSYKRMGKTSHMPMHLYVVYETEYLEIPVRRS